MIRLDHQLLNFSSHPGRRGLAGAGLADHGGLLAALQGQREAVEDLHFGTRLGGAAQNYGTSMDFHGISRDFHGIS